MTSLIKWPRVKSPLKWHGGKHYLAPKIVAMMPPHIHYVEPFAGGLSVLLAKDPEGVSEVVNDLNRNLASFWQVLRCDMRFKEFVAIINACPFSEQLFQDALEVLETNRHIRLSPPVDLAVAFFVACRQSLAGRMKSFAPLSRTRTRRGMNEQTSAWINAIDGLPEVHARLRRVVVLNRNALDVIRQEDGPDTLFYLDPPYLHETRQSTKDYEHEMTAEKHTDLCTVIRKCKGMVMISGYPSSLYKFQLEDMGWHRTDFDLPNNSAGGKQKRRMTECVWTNFKPEAK